MAWSWGAQSERPQQGMKMPEAQRPPAFAQKLRQKTGIRATHASVSEQILKKGPTIHCKIK